MSVSKKLVEELKALGEGMLYFTVWFGLFSVVLDLLLTDYNISPVGFSKVLIGALILAKVVIILEHYPLGRWERARPAWIGILARTVLYGVGAFIVMILEKAFEARHEYGGLGPALSGLFKHADFYHILANTICATGALLGYNMLSVVRRHLGPGGLSKLLKSPIESSSE